MVKISTEERKRDLEEVERIASKSKLTQKDADIIGKKIKIGMAKKFYAPHN